MRCSICESSKSKQISISCDPINVSPEISNTYSFTFSRFYIFPIAEKRTVGERKKISNVYILSRSLHLYKYIGETNRHISIRVRKHLSTDKNSNIFKYLRSTDVYRLVMIIALQFLTQQMLTITLKLNKLYIL